jgi:hypothetical protein
VAVYLGAIDPCRDQARVVSPIHFRLVTMSRMPDVEAIFDRSCPSCGYALRGLAGGTCPECGEELSQALFEKARRRHKRHRRLVALAIIGFIMYVPHAWLVLIDHPWDQQRWLWLGLWPVLPGLPASLLDRFVLGLRLPDWLDFVTMGAFAAGELLLLSWLGSRSKRWLIGVSLVALPPSIYLGIVSHALFHL